MSAEIVIANFLRVAGQDLEGAKLLLAGGNRNAAYLCEQAAEKVIRAVPTSEGKHAGVRHQLDEMVDAIPDENPIKPLLAAIQHLAAFATTFRYPSPTGKIKPPPSGAQVEADIAKVKEALSQSTAHFGVDLGKPNEPAATPGPIRS